LKPWIEKHGDFLKRKILVEEIMAIENLKKAHDSRVLGFHCLIF
jgi:hypothetical protein